MNHSSSARTARNASRFVVTAGKPSRMRKRMTSPKIARVPVPVRSSRSTPWSMALRRMSRYCRTRLVCRRLVHPAADPHPAHLSTVAQELAARVLQRALELDIKRRGRLETEVLLLPPLGDLGVQQTAAHGIRLDRDSRVPVGREHEHALLADRDAAVVLETQALIVSQEPRDADLSVEI